MSTALESTMFVIIDRLDAESLRRAADSIGKIRPMLTGEPVEARRGAALACLLLALDDGVQPGPPATPPPAPAGTAPAPPPPPDLIQPLPELPKEWCDPSGQYVPKDRTIEFLAIPPEMAGELLKRAHRNGHLRPVRPGPGPGVWFRTADVLKLGDKLREVGRRIEEAEASGVPLHLPSARRKRRKKYRRRRKEPRRPVFDDAGSLVADWSVDDEGFVCQARTGMALGITRGRLIEFERMGAITRHADPTGRRVGYPISEIAPLVEWARKAKGHTRRRSG